MKLANEHHFVRYCKPTQIKDGKIMATAFLLRSMYNNKDGMQGEKTLSVDWFEFFKENHYQNINQALIGRNFQTKPNGFLAKLNVGAIIKLINDTVQFNKYPLYIENNGKNSHSDFYGLDKIPEDNINTIGDIIIDNILEQKKISDI